MRTIDADALIAHINECIDVQNDNWEFERVIGLTIALECISDAPTIEPELKWIPVSERPPEESGFYNVSVINMHDRAYTKCAYYNKDHDYWDAKQKIVAWMPLLPVYEGE